ncbi:hypothetical protein ACOWNM_00970 [Helicobacter pylori]
MQQFCGLALQHAFNLVIDNKAHNSANRYTTAHTITTILKPIFVDFIPFALLKRIDRE